jgi:hypothetical protein
MTFISAVFGQISSIGHLGVRRRPSIAWEEFQPLIFLYGNIRSLGATEPVDEESYQRAHSRLGEYLHLLTHLAAKGVLDQGELGAARSKLRAFVAKFS